MAFRHIIRNPVLSLLRHRRQHVILHITERCDLRCKTCFVHKTEREMPLETAGKIAGMLRGVHWLDIGGGEPFLHKDLAAICRLFPKSVITIPTNGQRPEHIHETARELATIVKKELTLALSLDGFREVNDGIRGAGSFEKAMETFRLLRDIRGVKLKVNTVVCNANSKTLLDFMRFIREQGPDYHSLLLLRGAPEDPALALPPMAELEAMTPELLRILGSYDYGDGGNPVLRVLKKRYQRYLWNISLKTLATQRCHVPCKAPWLHKVIYTDGSIALCELMPPVGNILEEPLPLLEEKMIAALRDYEYANGPCYCTHNCNMNENIRTHSRSILSILTGIDL
ncbi:MAG TPA: radical SAM protein [Candidatus Hydrogenedentes bacterium]|nr:radical SAM protein [Candidatus Hydrogenedentota bacterium]